jgi:hypothetical protein
MRDENFEAFIADQIISDQIISDQIISFKSSSKDEPLFSIKSNLELLDIWRDSTHFIVIKSCIPNSNKKAQNFTKNLNKQETIDEINKFLHNILR